MTRINAFRSIRGSREFLAWGKKLPLKNLNPKQISANLKGSVNALIFAAVLIACSISVGCSSDKPKQISSNNQIPAMQAPTPVASTPAPAPVMEAEKKPAAKKVVHRKPATVNYADKTYGVTFEYPRRYAIETGDAASDLLASSPVPMNFVQPGGVALAAVELPETGFANTDFSSAYFDVSIHKGLTADQCSEFAVPQPKVVETMSTPAPTSTEPSPATNVASAPASTEAGTTPATTQTPSTETASAQPASAQAGSTESPSTPSAASASTTTSPDSGQASTSSAAEPQGSKLMIGDLELRAAEAVSGEGTRQSDSKYFHVYQNGACYEFAVNVTTVASEDGLIKHVDRDKVFDRLEKILATVKIENLKPAAPEVTAEAPAAPAVQPAPAQ